ncbi:MAG TPA: UDP-N-acetylglucosamine 2-epimerase (non-hydrolyzing), partial [Blastocatellia bacterium]|nr:UDP-N-acetylglucosamine 2-epimerase (non-hydrolyzing) [Blastocatellia bacterium]
DHRLVITAQHQEMLYQALAIFGMKPDVDLGLMQQNQSLGGFASRALAALFDLFGSIRPDAVLIQGDTTTATVGALAAFYQGIMVGHIEAGLRSFDTNNPFPEEMNRRLASCIANLHFAPTERARRNLLSEGVAQENVFVTGNTVVDALKSIPLGTDFDDARLRQIDFDGKRVLLVTAHRRENHGLPLRLICCALRNIVADFPDVEIVYPAHLNPNVRDVVNEELGGLAAIHLIPPLSYRDMLRLMSRCYFILTDSGGIQEEAPSFNKPVLILRETTERPEIVESGAGRIVGTDLDKIVKAAALILSDPREYLAMSTAENPFGDGAAARRIVDVIEQRLTGYFEPPPEPAYDSVRRLAAGS